MTKPLILDFKKQYAVSVYNPDNAEHVPEVLIEFQTNDQLFFEVLHVELRGKTILSCVTYEKKQNATV